jgi:hypothetical protein
MKAAALHQAIYTKLNDASITALLSTVYTPLVAIFTDVPQQADGENEAAFPFITIGSNVITPNDTKDKVGGNGIVQIDVWDRDASMLGIEAIADAIDLQMRRTALTIAGATHVTTELESSTQSKDPDGKTKRILLLYRVLWYNT